MIDSEAPAPDLIVHVGRAADAMRPTGETLRVDV